MRFAAVINIPDIDHFAQPAFTVVDAFKTVEEAQKWCEENSILLKADGFEIDILDLFEWIFPMEVDETKIPLKFSNKQETEVFEYMSTQSKQAETHMNQQQPVANQQKNPVVDAKVVDAKAN